MSAADYERERTEEMDQLINSRIPYYDLNGSGVNVGPISAFLAVGNTAIGLYQKGLDPKAPPPADPGHGLTREYATQHLLSSEGTLANVRTTTWGGQIVEAPVDINLRLLRLGILPIADFQRHYKEAGKIALHKAINALALQAKGSGKIADAMEKERELITTKRELDAKRASFTKSQRAYYETSATDLLGDSQSMPAQGYPRQPTRKDQNPPEQFDKPKRGGKQKPGGGPNDPTQRLPGREPKSRPKPGDDKK